MCYKTDDVQMQIYVPGIGLKMPASCCSGSGGEFLPSVTSSSSFSSPWITAILSRSRSANDVTRFTELAFLATITAFLKSGIYSSIENNWFIINISTSLLYKLFWDFFQKILSSKWNKYDRHYHPCLKNTHTKKQNFSFKLVHVL